MGSELGFFKMGVTAAILRAGGTTAELRLELTSIVPRCFYINEPVRSRLGTPGNFTILSQVACIKLRG